MKCSFSGRKNLPLLDRPNLQPPVFRMKWQQFSAPCFEVPPNPKMLPTRFCLRRTTDRFFRGAFEISTSEKLPSNSRQITTSKINDFNPPEMNTCRTIRVGYHPHFS